MPGQLGQGLFIAAQSPFGCAHKIMDRRIALAHLLQNRFGRDPAVHDPYPFGLAVLILYRLEKALQRGVVGGIAAITS